ncbi:hypothetical protein HWV62_5286 [Athelia sp. TMB]|nr:hypothetical protein HWV62_5286 [Athelia sp. TMB]
MSYFSSGGASSFPSSNSPAGSEFDFSNDEHSFSSDYRGVSTPPPNPGFDFQGPLLYQHRRTTRNIPSSSQHSRNTPSVGSSEPPLSELLGFRAVRELYEEAKAANKLLAVVIGQMETQGQLQQEVIRLSSIIQPGFDVPGLTNPSIKRSTSQPSHGVSLAPSDSLSQVPSRTPSSSFLPPISPLHQSASRPLDYPFEVLWCLDDCKDDADVKISPGNDSRPAMNTAIRNADGSLITAGVWDAIKLSSRQVAQSLLGMKFSARETSRSVTARELTRDGSWNSELAS